VRRIVLYERACSNIGDAGSNCLVKTVQSGPTTTATTIVEGGQGSGIE